MFYNGLSINEVKINTVEREIKKLTKEEIKKLKEELKDCVSYSDYLHEKLKNCPSAEDVGICDKKCLISDNYESLFLLVLVWIRSLDIEKIKN